jgi:DNA-binding NtrC family response regulator
MTDNLDKISITELKKSELVGYFIRNFNAQQGLNITGVSQQALEAMQKYRWPGNIRELANAIERAIIFCDGETINLADLPRDIASPAL